MQEISKIDKLGCFIEHIGKTIQKLDDNFADVNGDIKIKGIAEILKVAGFAYSEIKTAYEDCLGKEFTIELGNDMIENVFKMLLEILPKPTESSEAAINAEEVTIQN